MLKSVSVNPTKFMDIAKNWINMQELLNLNGNKKIDQRFTKFPSLDKLLELEKLSRQKGSGIELDSLIGLWKFVSVWKKGTDNEDKMSSSLLRLFSASLELKKQQVNEDLLKFDLSNSIQFGKLSIIVGVIKICPCLW